MEADFYSKVFDFDDWDFADHIFKMAAGRWGEFSFDRFANDINYKVQRYNSRFYTRETSGVDAFAFAWGNENNWLVPPICLVCRVLSHMFMCKAKGVLVVPKWKSALYWPLLWDDKNQCFNNFVTDYLEFKNPKNFFVAGSDKNSILTKSPFHSSVIILRLDYSNQ